MFAFVAVERDGARGQGAERQLAIQLQCDCAMQPERLSQYVARHGSVCMSLKGCVCV